MCFSKYLKKNYAVISAGIFVTLLIACLGCSGPSTEEKKKLAQSERRELRLKESEKEKEFFQALAAQNNATLFPPAIIDENSTTYDFQNFISSTSNAIIFRGYIDDIESQNNEIVAEFTCKIADDYTSRDKVLNFSLTVPPVHLEALRSFAKSRNKGISDTFKFLREPDCYVVAKILKITKPTGTNFTGSVSSEGASARATSQITRVLSGNLVNLQAFPNAGQGK